MKLLYILTSKNLDLDLINFSTRNPRAAQGGGGPSDPASEDAMKRCHEVMMMMMMMIISPFGHLGCGRPLQKV
jgi:hypothetical protein